MLNQLDKDLWEISHPIKVPGLRFEHRMTVIKLRSGGLLIHSPVAYDDGLARDLAALGPIECLVAPSTQHDMYWDEWFRKFPNAQFFCAPGVRREHPHLPFQHDLGGAVPYPWADEIETHLLRGVPKLNEVVLLHRASRSLIVADLIFNLSTEQGFLGKVFLKLNGIYGRAGVSRIFRRFITDRAAFKTSVEEILRWDFDRVIVGHGNNLNTGGKDTLRKAFDWLL